MIFGIQDVKRDVFGIGAAVQGASAVVGSGLQAFAANHATDVAAQSAANSLGFQQNVFNTQQNNEAPWLQAGKTALGQLSAGTGPGGNLVSTYGKTFDGGPGFAAPTGVNAQNDPGYAFRLAEGQKALERSQAAKGTGTGGAALKEAARYGQDYASNEYGNVYNRALSQYQTNFGDKLSEYNTNYNTFANDQSNQYNRLASLAGVGQTANSQLSQSGQAAASNVAGINSNFANQAGNNAISAGNSISAGLVGAGNAINSGINNYQNYNTLQQLLAQSQSGYGDEWTPPNATYHG